LVGKCFAVGVLINLMTTLPALALFFQYGFLDSWDYFFRGGRVLGSVQWHESILAIKASNPLFFGILGYGLLLTCCLSLFLVATACWLERTVPMIMAWITPLLFFRLLANAL